MRQIGRHNKSLEQTGYAGCSASSLCSRMMNSLTEIESEVEAFAKASVGETGKTLWDKLVESSREMHAAGCDGILLGGLEEHTEQLLSKIDEPELYEVWQETENGVMTIEGGNGAPEVFEMVHDIGLEVIWNLVDRICQEAKGKPKGRA